MSAASDDKHIGALVAGKFRVESLLGQGGMGAVYRARHTELGEPVAIKFLSRLWSQDPEYRERFRREAVILARLRHPGIVSVLDFGEENGELFMAMELVRGQELAALISEPSGDLVPLIRLQSIFDQMLAVLEAAHATGVIHRDMKPENVMLLEAEDRGDRIKLLDFGIAHVSEQDQKLTQTGTVRGTPWYMSPEQCRGEDVGPKTDVYAVGVMLFQALAGRLPFDAEHAAGVMAQQMFLDPPAMADVSPREIPPGIEAVTRLALAKDHGARPTAAEFRDALGAAFRGTDAVTLAEHAAAERQRVAHLSRSDRALTGKQRPTEAKLDGGRVVLMFAKETEAEDFRGRLGVQGFDTTIVKKELPGKVLGDRVCVLFDHALGSERFAQLRAHALLGAAPVCVMHVPSPRDLAPWIRAGASDAVLAGQSAQGIEHKVSRMLRRKR